MSHDEGLFDATPGELHRLVISTYTCINRFYVDLKLPGGIYEDDDAKFK